MTIFRHPTYYPDILKELESKPGVTHVRKFKASDFQEGVESIRDLKPWYALGARQQCGELVPLLICGVPSGRPGANISMPQRNFRQGRPRDVVKAGDLFRVKVMAVEYPPPRTALTMRLSE